MAHISAASTALFQLISKLPFFYLQNSFIDVRSHNFLYNRRKPDSGKISMNVYLYDADGTDETLEFSADVCQKIGDNQLLWIDISERQRTQIEQVTVALDLKNVSTEAILKEKERPKLDKFENFYRFFIISVKSGDDRKFEKVPIDFIVGKNFVITVHNGEVNYFAEFREREKGETNIGALDAESFVETLLDLHFVSYFRALEKIERMVDKFDETILQKDLKDEDFLKKMVELRSEVSKLRQWFLPQRDVFYALSRPDFTQTVASDSFEDFKMLGEHFESAVVAIENSRDTVLSLFDLYTTRAAHRMNQTIKTLTFVTIISGGLSVIAGVLGMNFEVGFFKSPGGFWIAIAGMGLLAGALAIVAKIKNWI